MTVLLFGRQMICGKLE